jgi:hypothetical protein
MQSVEVAVELEICVIEDGHFGVTTFCHSFCLVIVIMHLRTILS